MRFLARSAVAVALFVSLPLVSQAQVQSILGTVHTSGDSLLPLAGAEVLVANRKAMTDARGRFRIDSLRIGEHILTIRHIGYRPVRAKVVVVASEPTELTYFMKHSPYLLPELVVESRRSGIYGKVTDLTGRPVSGAQVEAIGFNGTAVTTDSLGQFSLPDARKGGYLVRVTGDGYVERRLTLEVENGKGRDVTVQLAPGESRAVGNREAAALFDLRQSLATGFMRERLMGAEVARYGSLSVCDVPRIRNVVGEFPRGMLNGEREILPGQLCTWRMDEVAMVQFVPGPVRRTRNGVIRDPGYVILWEKW